MTRESDLEKRVSALEISLAHQQRLCEELNQVVTQQTRQLLQFERSIPKLTRQLDDFKTVLRELGSPPVNDEPPHY